MGSTGKENWKCMLPTSNLQLQIKDFLWSSDMSGSSYNSDHLYLTFTTKSVWIQTYNLFQQNTLRTARVPHFLPVETDEIPGNARVHLSFCSKCAYSGLCQTCFFTAISRKSVSDQLLWKQKPSPKDKPDRFSRCQLGTNRFLSLCLVSKQCCEITPLWRW